MMLMDTCVCLGLVMAFLLVAGGFIKFGEWVYFRKQPAPCMQKTEAPRRVGLARCVLDFLM